MSYQLNNILLELIKKSCFKADQKSLNGYCRYGFPGLQNMILERKTNPDYINEHNTLKSNNLPITHATLKCKRAV